MSALAFRERPPAAEPDGLLVLHHGRGADEYDLLGLADVLDPRGPLRTVIPVRPWTPQGQLSVAVRSPVPLSEERLLAAP